VKEESVSYPDVIQGAVFSNCRVDECGTEYQTAHSARWLARWSADVDRCKGIILPLVRQFGTYDVTGVICPRCLFAREKEWDMRRRGKGTSSATEATPVATDETTDQETTVSETTDTGFVWDDAPAEGAVVATDPPAAPVEVEPSTASNGETTAPAKPAGPTSLEKLQEEFPIGTVVILIKTDWKNSYGTVKGYEDKRNVQYVSVVLTHNATGAERPEDKRIRVTVRPTSIEKAEIPKQSAPEPTDTAEATED